MEGQAEAFAKQLKLVRDATCLFRISVAYSARSEQTHQRWVNGATVGADYNNKQQLTASAYAKNYAHVFPSDCPAVINGSDNRAPSKLAARLETLAARLSPADRHALAPHLSADALAKSTGEAAVAHTAGECAACNLLRQTLPLSLRCVGLPSARKGPPAGVELGSVREEGRGSIRSVRVQKYPRCHSPTPDSAPSIAAPPCMAAWGDSHLTHMPRKATSTASRCPPGQPPSAYGRCSTHVERVSIDPGDVEYVK